MGRTSAIVIGASLAVLVTGVSSLATTGAQRPSEHVRVYRGVTEPLTLDAAGRVAVLVSDAGALKAIAGAIGSEVGDAEASSLVGWWLIRVGAGMTVEQAAGVLASREDVGFVSPVYLDRRGGPLWMGPRMLVGRDAGVGLDVEHAKVTELMPGVESVEVSTRSGLELLQRANAMAAKAGVRFAEPDWAFTGGSALTPNDTFYPSQWAMNQANNWDMNAPQAWDVTTGSSSIITVIIDTGVELTHPDLNLAPGTDTTGAALTGQPGNACDNHGTPVAGCVSARINNGLGCVGIAPSTRSSSARTFVSNLSCDGSWSSFASYTVNSLAFAQSTGARVTNNSNYYGFTSGAIESAYATTYAAGIVHFASAGNNGTGTIAYPSSVAFVNSVAALASSGARAGFSQFGPGLDFIAPGASVISADITGAGGYVPGDYVIVNGTSFASPYAAGVAALVLSKNASLTASEVEGIMQSTARDMGSVGYDTGFGWGLVDAHAALLATPSACVADFDGIGGVTFDDIFAMLNAWFAGSAQADVDGLAGLSFNDIFFFLNAWFAGC